MIINAYIKRDTEKAILVNFCLKDIWLPKSQIKQLSRGNGAAQIELPDWLARSNDIDVLQNKSIYFKKLTEERNKKEEEEKRIDEIRRIVKDELNKREKEKTPDKNENEYQEKEITIDKVALSKQWVKRWV
jgi:hypothetical protein